MIKIAKAKKMPLIILKRKTYALINKAIIDRC